MGQQEGSGAGPWSWAAQTAEACSLCGGEPSLGRLGARKAEGPGRGFAFLLKKQQGVSQQEASLLHGLTPQFWERVSLSHLSYMFLWLKKKSLFSFDSNFTYIVNIEIKSKGVCRRGDLVLSIPAGPPPDRHIGPACSG